MTKRLLYRLLVGVMAFAVGLSFAALWKAHRPMSLCELEANPEAYAGKTIRFRGIVDRSRDIITACSFCSANIAAAVTIELTPEEAAKFSLPENSYTREAVNNESYAMDAVIVGKLDPYFSLGCFTPKYHIKNAKIERVIAVKQFSNFEEAVQWYKSNSY